MLAGLLPSSFDWRMCERGAPRGCGLPVLDVPALGRRRALLRLGDGSRSSALSSMAMSVARRPLVGLAITAGCCAEAQAEVPVPGKYEDGDGDGKPDMPTWTDGDGSGCDCETGELSTASRTGSKAGIAELRARSRGQRESRLVTYDRSKRQFTFLFWHITISISGSDFETTACGYTTSR